MNRIIAVKRLAAVGFEIDWSVTGPNPEGGWSGTIDTIGHMSIDGDCFGLVIHADNAADWYRNAVTEAKGYKGHLRPCTDVKCDMHSPEAAKDRRT